MSDQINMEHLQQWIGKQQSTIDTVTITPVTALRVTLDQIEIDVQPGHRLPELWHWLYFLPMARQSDIGADGHPTRGGFLPPVSLPRRMWAGSQFEFHQPIHVGDVIERTSTIENVTHKNGKSGELVFVRVKHEIETIGANNIKSMAITEFHDIVYRQTPQATTTQSEPNTTHNVSKAHSASKEIVQLNTTPPASKSVSQTADWEQLVDADEVLLFRYSALTFNGHRIHYDRRYVTEVEGYPGLIVHGPLIATLLLDALNKAMNNPVITHYEFKALKPIFDTQPFHVCGAVDSDGTTVRLWARDHLGDVTMQATATVKKNTA